MPGPPGVPDMTFLYQVITGMDQKLDRLIETFVTVREYAKIESRVSDLESRWRRNATWLIALVGALSSLGYLIVFLTR